ncbi:uncharacterized protein LY79DRAFT_578744 [Colletotrichum navitas]|uniref:Uncharacterized protein n=1 Tax=Colletotrichum navitas TaxID=681940 RepID=A0AAD8Q3E3_9PEZI|nr:uncharacterized protein LY79DRAFT_578744 [Colletotrichum navitas]KAK1594476.1 hypothetical protein LY79DRAFT_578744 [Colletotrichum navitas]
MLEYRKEPEGEAWKQDKVPERQTGGACSNFGDSRAEVPDETGRKEVTTLAASLSLLSVSSTYLNYLAYIPTYLEVVGVDEGGCRRCRLRSGEPSQLRTTVRQPGLIRLRPKLSTEHRRGMAFVTLSAGRSEPHPKYLARELQCTQPGGPGLTQKRVGCRLAVGWRTASSA